MSAPDYPDISEVEQLVQYLRDLMKSLGANLDAPDTGPLLLAILRLVSLGQSQPAKSRRKPTWKAGQYEELFRDVNQTKARLNCSIKDAIAHLREDSNGPWCKLTQQSLEPRYREACRHARDASRDRIARLLIQQVSPSQAKAP